MLKLHLFFITLSISTRKQEPSRVAKRYENDLRIRRLIEENHRKYHDHFHLFH
ncbi:MAG TPA: hypothetical protein VF199_07425 [Bacillales bacterium]